MKPEQILFMYQEFLEKHEGDLFPYDIAVWINEHFVLKADHIKLIKENEKLKQLDTKGQHND